MREKNLSIVTIKWSHQFTLSSQSGMGVGVIRTSHPIVFPFLPSWSYCVVSDVAQDVYHNLPFNHKSILPHVCILVFFFPSCLQSLSLLIMLSLKCEWQPVISLSVLILAIVFSMSPSCGNPCLVKSGRILSRMAVLSRMPVLSIQSCSQIPHTLTLLRSQFLFSVSLGSLECCSSLWWWRKIREKDGGEMWCPATTDDDDHHPLLQTWWWERRDVFFPFLLCERGNHVSTFLSYGHEKRGRVKISHVTSKADEDD